MSVAPTLVLTPSCPRRPGRPRVVESPDQRRRHIECAALYYGTDWPVKRIAASLGISRRTAYRHLGRAMTYDDPEAEALRRLAP